MVAPLKFSLLSALAFATISTFAAESSATWPSWRGPRQDGSAAPGTYPVKWDATNGVLWKTALPGRGCSTPAVWDRRIFLTAPVDGRDAVLAFDWSGREVWRRTLGPGRAGKNKVASGCNPSPVTDGQGVFVFFKSGDLAAFDVDGTPRWQTNLFVHFGKDNLFWDFGTSPVLAGTNLVVALMRHGDSWLLAFDPRTGQLRWQVPRDYPTPTEGDNSYATPLVLPQQGELALLVWGATHLTAHAVADGRLLWDCSGFNPDAKPFWPSVASPVVTGEFAVIPYGRGSLLYGARLGGRGDVTATHRAWDRRDTGAYTPTPTVANGRVILLRDEGEILCLDPATGRTLWSGTLPRSSNKFYASPIVADGKIYAAREDGAVFVVRAEGPFELLAENRLDDHFIASPVPVDNRLFLRGDSALFCLGAK